jgi:AraC family transcriptional regulator
VHGDIDIIPAHTSSRWEIMDANDTALILSLPAALLNIVVEEYGFDPHRVEFRNRFQVRDPQIENICWALKTEMESSYSSGRLYTDSLVVSVASRIVSCHSSIENSAREEHRGIGGRKLKDVLSYIDDNLANDVSLSKIASIAGVSVSHLKKIFRESAGMPVHQYVIRRRLERAKTLLREGKRPLAEIALMAGFAHQSHLARQMRRVLGISPSDIRQMSETLRRDNQTR